MRGASAGWIAAVVGRGETNLTELCMAAAFDRAQYCTPTLVAAVPDPVPWTPVVLERLLEDGGRWGARR